MEIREIEIKTPHGLHLRVAAKVVEKSKNSQSKIIFYKDGQQADASSILELLLLAAPQDSKIKMVVEGKDEQKTIDEISLVLIDGAGI